ncbi:MAG: alpha/beta fold hydrolase [Puniceicoccales bacterium]|jgi:haloalkane dehalogenase|nr:alpha/beta fold hydrolase [Puniceicoccales bacterium]
MASSLPNSLRSLYPFDSHFVRLPDRTRMHYVDEGDGNMVLFFHDIPLWSFYFRNLIRDLRAQFRCVAPDYRGFGLSSKPSHLNYSLRSITDDVLAFLRELNVGKFSLVLHGWGGVPGMVVAARWPERVRRIVLLNANCFMGYRMPLSHSFFRAGGWGTVAVNLLNWPARQAALGAAVSGRVRAGYRYPYRSWSSRTPTRVFFENLPRNPKKGIGLWLGEEAEKMGIICQKKSIAFWGVKDLVFPEETLDKWGEYLEELKIHRFPYGGRYVLEDDYGTIFPLLRRFLADGMEIKLPV